MITLSNGHKLDFCAASGALGFDGDDAGHGIIKLWKKPFRWLRYLRPSELTIIAKTVTYETEEGNLKWWCPWRCVRPISGGWVNAVALTNPGYISWSDKYYNHICKRKYKVIPSISTNKPIEAALMCDHFNRLSDLVGIQINVSCPNVAHTTDLDKVLAIIQSAQRTTSHPILIKLGYQDDYLGILQAIEKYKLRVEAVELINTVPWHVIHPNQPSPLAKYNLEGGISGTKTAHLAREALKNVKNAGIKIPVISGNGIYSYNELVVRHGLGADAYAFGTLFTNRPWLPNALIARFRREFP